MYQHILVPLDGSKLAEQVLPQVKKSAGSETDITLLRAMPAEYVAAVEQAGRYTTTFSPEEQLARTQAEEQAYLEKIAEKLRAEGYQVHTQVSRGHAADTIVDYAHHHPVDLIIIATHGRSGVDRWIFGSVTQKVLHSARVPVLVVRPDKVDED
jgi:nucleotide-binding universal stress UspA family protein